MSRIVRGQVLKYKNQEFVLAAKTLVQVIPELSVNIYCRISWRLLSLI